MLEALTDEHIFQGAGILVILVFAVIAYLAYLGAFRKINVSTQEPPFGDMTICYKIGQGPYKNAGQLFQECQRIDSKRDLIGIYYDDPESVPEDALRFAVGVIVAKNDEIPEPDVMDPLLSSGFKIAVLPKPNFAVMTSFPFRSYLSLYIAIFRVYPTLKSYIFEKGLCAYPAVEIYSNSEIKFMMPLSRQEDFFVPEFSEEMSSNATTEVSSHLDVDVRASLSRDADGEDEFRHEAIQDVSDSDAHDASGDHVFARPVTPPPRPCDVSRSQESEDEASSASSFEEIASAEAKLDA